MIYAGDKRIPVIGYGDIILQLALPAPGNKYLTLRDVAYCKEFICNVVSLRRLQASGIWWDMSPGNSCLRNTSGRRICRLEDQHDQFVIERDHIQSAVTAQAAGPTRRSTQDKISSATAHQWHLRLGHPGPEALNRFVNASTGAIVKGPTTVECDDCGMTKLMRQISRIPRQHHEGPGLRVAVDFTHLIPDCEGYDSLMLITDRWSGYIWSFHLTNRTASNLIKAFTLFLTTFERQYRIKPQVFECDNEITMIKRAVQPMLEAQGIVIEPSTPDTPAQNGGAERSGGVIETKAKAMRLGAHLPEDLWREVFDTAIYLHNRLPRYTYNWKSPYDRFYTYLAHRDGVVVRDRKPRQGHLRVYGCKAFAMTSKAKKRQGKLHKLDPKAFIGYLVGYRSTNIYRIWNPLLDTIISTRDVIFNESEVFPGSVESLKDDFLRVKRADIAALLDSIEEAEPTLETREKPSDDPVPYHFDDDDATAAEGEALDGGETEQDRREKDGAAEGPEAQYPTPQESPLAALFAYTITTMEEPGWLNLAAEDTDQLKMDTSGYWQSSFASGRLIAPIGTHEGKQIDRAGLRRLLKKAPRRDYQGTHRSELPSPPRHRSELKGHPLADLFIEAEKTHLQSHADMKSWIEIPRHSANDQQVLDCMWVYTYKFNKAGYFIKCKARLVVRGDQQQLGTTEETYASTLAGRSFRTLMAIAARFDLELIQYDAVNAFINAELDHDVFMKMPPGYGKPGTILCLKKALYGLRESPKLWQKELQGTLSQLGLEQVPEEPCCMILGGIIVFYYVDDIVIGFDKSQRLKVDRLVNQLKSKYNLTGGHELEWFLGIEIIRNRDKRLIWLSQSQYALKITKLITHLDGGSSAATPMQKSELLPYEGRATIANIRSYQRKIGSLLYIAVISRPDIAFAVSRLARFSQNPGPKHHIAADRVMLYLRYRHGLALQFGGDNDFIVASDASFADNTIDRKSSQAYIVKLFGGIIGWRANKQATVTTSTTEAELLALSQAAKEGMFIGRLLKGLQINLNPMDKVRIQCDNLQTIKLVTKELGQLNTRLRHVDVHRHWLRQEVQNGTVVVEYTPTEEMLADGLTKALPREAHESFVKQLRLVDVTSQLDKKRGLEDLTADIQNLRLRLE